MGFSVFFEPDIVVLLWSKTLEVAYVGHVENELYVVDFSGSTNTQAMYLFRKAGVRWLWHCLLSHVNKRTLQSFHKGGHILGLKENVSFAKDRVCRACVEGKMHDSPHKARPSFYKMGSWSFSMLISLVSFPKLVLVGRNIAY